MRQILAVILFMALAFVSCDRQIKYARTKTPREDTVIVATTLISSQVTNDSTLYDTLVYPGQFTDEFDVLTTGTFHADEVEDNSGQRDWFGVFLGEQNCYLGKTKIKSDKVYDPILDEEGEKTGWKVSTDNADSCIILMGSTFNLNETIIKRLNLTKYIYPEDTFDFDYMGVNYKLIATGGKRRVQDNPEWFEVWNYKLYLVAEVDGKERKSLLVAHRNFDDNMTQIIFAGDIDGDKILDLIIDTSRHYNATSPTIYLSKPAIEPEILKPMGRHTSVGC